MCFHQSMTSTEQTPVPILLGVILSLQAELQAQRVEATRVREESRREIARLVAMVEGLTKQLDQLLCAPPRYLMSTEARNSRVADVPDRLSGRERPATSLDPCGIPVQRIAMR